MLLGSIELSSWLESIFGGDFTEDSLGFVGIFWDFLRIFGICWDLLGMFWDRYGLFGGSCWIREYSRRILTRFFKILPIQWFEGSFTPATGSSGHPKDLLGSKNHWRSLWIPPPRRIPAGCCSRILQGLLKDCGHRWR